MFFIGMCDPCKGDKNDSGIKNSNPNKWKD